jgi:hypothetical protein
LEKSSNPLLPSLSLSLCCCFESLPIFEPYTKRFHHQYIHMNCPKVYNFGVGDLVTTRPSPDGGLIPYEALQDMYYVPILQRQDEASTMEYISTREVTKTEKLSTRFHLSKSSPHKICLEDDDPPMSAISHRRSHRSNGTSTKATKGHRSHSERTIRRTNESSLDTQRRSTSCPSDLLACQHHPTTSPNHKSRIKNSSKSKLNSITAIQTTTMNDTNKAEITTNDAATDTRKWQHLVHSNSQSRRHLLDKKSTRKSSTGYCMESILNKSNDDEADAIMSNTGTTIHTHSTPRRVKRLSKQSFDSSISTPQVSMSLSSNSSLYSSSSVSSSSNFSSTKGSTHLSILPPGA